MKTFTELHAYAAIENDVIANLSTYIHCKAEDVLTIVIVGAFDGNDITRMMPLYPHAHFIAIEPYSENFFMLKKKYGNHPRVKCLNVACSDFEGEANFYELSAGGNGSLLKVSDKSIYKLKEIGQVKVQVRTLDSILENVSVDLLWMDVQGNELNVLKGYKNQDKALSMYLEVAVEGCGHESYEGNCHLSDLEKHLTGHTLHSIGLDNELKNGTGNSFWLRKDLI